VKNSFVLVAATTCFLLSILFPVCGVLAADEEGLVAHWDFSEGKGDILHDRSGNNNHGKIHGAKWARCGKGYALEFDGVDDYVDCGAHAVLDVEREGSVELWCNVNLPQGGLVNRSCGKDWPDQRLVIVLRGNGTIQGALGDGKTPVLDMRIGDFGKAALNAWVHLAMTWNAEKRVLYRNGRSLHAVSRPVLPKLHGIPLILGRSTGFERDFFKGLMDDVRVHQRALSEKEIIQHYNQTAAEKGRPLLDTSWFDRLKLTPYFYLDVNQLVVDVDFRGFLPLPEGAKIRAELARAGAEKPLLTQEIKAPSKVTILADATHAEATFALAELAPGNYEVRASLKDKAGLRASDKVAFNYPPPALTVSSPEAKVVGPLPEPLQPITYDLELCDGGGFKVVVEGETYPVESTFSYPHGGDNTFLASSRKGTECEPSWTVTTWKVKRTEYRVLARGKYYAIKRRISLHPHRVSIFDMITNLTDEDIGIIINNHLGVRGKNFTAIRCGGHKHQSGWSLALHNPTVFVGKKSLGFGMTAIDDVYVVHGKLYADEEHAGILDDMFGLGPKASYTMAWAFYPVGSEDYFDFINVLRNDLGLNGKTVDGGFAFVSRSPFDRRKVPASEFVEVRNIKYGAHHCPSGAADDPQVSIEGIEFIDFPKEMALTKRTLAETREKFPDLKLMFHVAHSLYATNRPDEKYPDSRVIDSKGEHVVYAGEDWYRRLLEADDKERNYFSKERVRDGWRWWIYYPTLDNSFGKAMLKAVDVMMDEIGTDGVFADGLMALFTANFTYDRWDDHTVEIDPKTKTIKRKFASIHLLCQPAIMAYCEKIASKGGVVICNSGPGTLTFARKAAVAAYPVETPGNEEKCCLTHLAPFPMALGWPNNKPQPRVYQDVQAKLMQGVLYGFSEQWSVGHSTIVSKMYPCTFEEIHSGYVKGRERLVTTHSGAYGWPGDRDLHFAYLTDARGVLVPNKFLTTVDRSGVRTEILLRENEMAVLRKIPATVRSRRPINLIAQQYDAEAVQILLNGQGRIEIAIRDGDFPVRPNASYFLKTDTMEKVRADTKGRLSFRIQLDGQLKIRIEAMTAR